MDINLCPAEKLLLVQIDINLCPPDKLVVEQMDINVCPPAGLLLDLLVLQMDKKWVLLKDSYLTKWT